MDIPILRRVPMTDIRSVMIFSVKLMVTKITSTNTSTKIRYNMDPIFSSSF